jgi:hypothetical protein
VQREERRKLKRKVSSNDHQTSEMVGKVEVQEQAGRAIDWEKRSDVGGLEKSRNRTEPVGWDGDS